MKRFHLEVTRVHVGDIQQHPENAWVGDLDTIRESMEANGIYRPVYVSKVTGNILAGNHTYQAQVDAGEEYIDVIYLDGLTPDGERRIMAVDNQSGRRGHYDPDALIPLLHTFGGDFTGTGFDQAYLDGLLNGLEQDEVEFEDMKPKSWSVIVECESFDQQQELVDRFMTEGLLARGTGTP